MLIISQVPVYTSSSQPASYDTVTHFPKYIGNRPRQSVDEHAVYLS